MISASRRMIYGSLQHNPPSRFLSDIDAEQVTSPELNVGYTPEPSYEPEQIKVSIGDKVRHQVFGKGEIVDLEEATATIKFSTSTKKLNLNFAPLEKL